MRKVVLENVALLGGLFVLGPLAGVLLLSQRGPDGSSHFSGLVSEQPAVTLLLMLVLIVVVGVLGAVFGRAVNRGVGLSFVGFTLLVAAWYTGDIDHLLRASPQSGTFVRLAIEGAFLAVAALIALGINLVATQSAAGELRSEVTSKGLPLAIAGGVVGACVGVWYGAFDLSRGQALLACVVGGVLAGAFGRLAGASADARSGLVGAFAAMMVMAIVGPIVGMIMDGSNILSAVVRSELVFVARPQPLDWVAGAFLGVPWGVAWAGAMADHKHEVTPARRGT